jgi:hypothetical protein
MQLSHASKDRAGEVGPVEGAGSAGSDKGAFRGRQRGEHGVLAQGVAPPQGAVRRGHQQARIDCLAQSRGRRRGVGTCRRRHQVPGQVPPEQRRHANHVAVVVLEGVDASGDSIDERLGHLDR